MFNFTHALNVDSLKSDTVDLTVPSRAFMVGVSGNVQFVTKNGDLVTIYAIAGVIYPIRMTRVYSAITAATGIINLW